MAEITKEPDVKADNYDAELVVDNDDQVSEKKGTSADRHAMWRMGKVQEMRASSAPIMDFTAHANVRIEEL
jgi:hypothetical protein